jgi:hypothetical protein
MMIMVFLLCGSAIAWRQEPVPSWHPGIEVLARRRMPRKKAIFEKTA